MRVKLVTYITDLGDQPASVAPHPLEKRLAHFRAERQLLDRSAQHALRRQVARVLLAKHCEAVGCQRELARKVLQATCVGSDTHCSNRAQPSVRD